MNIKMLEEAISANKLLLSNNTISLSIDKLTPSEQRELLSYLFQEGTITLNVKTDNKSTELVWCYCIYESDGISLNLGYLKLPALRKSSARRTIYDYPTNLDEIELTDETKLDYSNGTLIKYVLQNVNHDHIFLENGAWNGGHKNPYAPLPEKYNTLSKILNAVSFKQVETTVP